MKVLSILGLLIVCSISYGDDYVTIYPTETDRGEVQSYSSLMDNLEIIPCPDGIPGCAVLHYKSKEQSPVIIQSATEAWNISDLEIAPFPESITAPAEIEALKKENEALKKKIGILESIISGFSKLFLLITGE